MDLSEFFLVYFLCINYLRQVFSSSVWANFFGTHSLVNASVGFQFDYQMPALEVDAWSKALIFLREWWFCSYSD